MSERLDYEFTPTPRAALRALSAGLLDLADYAILAALYDRRMRGLRRVRFTLAELRDSIGWTSTDDALSKRLRRLRAKGWLRYEQPRTQPYRYDAELVSDRSDTGPSVRAAEEAGSDAAQARTAPSTRPLGPSTENGGNATTERAGATSAAVAGPSTSDVQTNPSSLDGDVGQEVSVDPTRAREERNHAAEAVDAVDRLREQKAAAAKQEALDFGEAQVALLREAAERGAAKRERGSTWEPNS